MLSIILKRKIRFDCIPPMSDNRSRIVYSMRLISVLSKSISKLKAMIIPGFLSSALEN